jgi:hypothetical protein
MSGRREIKSELMQLVNEIGDDRSQDLLLTIRAFAEQEAHKGFDTRSPEFLEKLNQSLRAAETGPLFSNEEVFNEIRRGIRDKMESARKERLH